MAFSIANLPRIGRAPYRGRTETYGDYRLLRGFQIKTADNLPARIPLNSELIRLESQEGFDKLGVITKLAGGSFDFWFGHLKKLMDMGIIECSLGEKPVINKNKLLRAIKLDSNALSGIYLRRSIRGWETGTWEQNLFEAVVGRLGDPEVVFKPFDIKTAAARYGEHEAGLLRAAYLESQSIE